MLCFLLILYSTLVWIVGIELCKLSAVLVGAFSVRLDGILREVILESIISEELGCLSEAEKVFEDVLAHETRDDAHGRG